MRSYNTTEISDTEFLFKSYIQRNINEVTPKYTYANESGINPAFQRIEDVDCLLRLNEKRIFALRSDFVLATGVKNSEQQLGYFGLEETFDRSQFAYINWQDRYGHPSLAIVDNYFNGGVFYAGFVCQRQDHLEIFLSSGRYNRCNRTEEGVLALTPEQIYLTESYLSLKFHQAYGKQDIIFYDTTPEQDEADSKLFFSNTLFSKHKKGRLYTSTHISEALIIALQHSCYAEAKEYIQKHIPALKPKYSYAGEGCINPGYQDIAQVKQKLLPLEKRIWVLRSDFILAIGVKNAYEKEYAYIGFKESFNPSLYSFINWQDRYGHPSLALADDHYDGSVLYAGYVCQRENHLQAYLVSGRFERTDLNEEQTRIVEAYIAAQLQVAYGKQDIIFEYGNSDIPTYHATFFSNGTFAKTNPQRHYNSSSIDHILKHIPAAPCNEIGQTFR